MKKYTKSNIWIVAFSISLFTVLGIYTLKTKSLMEINLVEWTFKIDARRNNLD